MEKPASIRIYFALLVLVVAVRGCRVFSGGSLSHAEREVAFLLFLILAVASFSLYALMVQGKNWARILLGIATLPLGLIILVAKSARMYTGAAVNMGAEGSVLDLDTPEASGQAAEQEDAPDEGRKEGAG